MKKLAIRHWAVIALGAAAALVPVLVTAQAPATKGGATKGAPAVAPVPATPLPWAYPTSAPVPPAPPNTDPTLKHVPNSTKGFTQAQITDGFNPPDWHPEEHPVMPDIVVHGRRPDIRACGLCHLPNGQGRPENATLAGLTAEYIEQQVNDFRNNLRKSAEPNMGPPANMLKLALVTNEAEVKIAAEYFSKIKYKEWVKVVETKTVPKTRVATGMLIPLEGTSEPIGSRIIEVPANVENTEIRDSQSGFIAYVPFGSVKKGEALVTKSSARTTQCAICHGKDLKGLGNVPFLAGRSPSYVVRQMYDIKTGARQGGWSPLMKGVVEKLTNDDLVNIAAYLASLKP